MDITKDIVYIGVDDNAIDLFEGQYDVPNGMCYNSYVILDEKIAVLDTVDKSFTDEWLEKLRAEGFEVTQEAEDVTIGSVPPMPIRCAFFNGPLGESIELFYVY